MGSLSVNIKQLFPHTVAWEIALLSYSQCFDILRLKMYNDISFSFFLCKGIFIQVALSPTCFTTSRVLSWFRAFQMSLRVNKRQPRLLYTQERKWLTNGATCFWVCHLSKEMNPKLNFTDKHLRLFKEFACVFVVIMCEGSHSLRASA